MVRLDAPRLRYRCPALPELLGIHALRRQHRQPRGHPPHPHPPRPPLLSATATASARSAQPHPRPLRRLPRRLSATPGTGPPPCPRPPAPAISPRDPPRGFRRPEQPRRCPPARASTAPPRAQSPVATRGYLRFGAKTCFEFPTFSLLLFAHEVRKCWWKWLRRRSNRHRLTPARFTALLERYPLPRPRIAVRLWGP
jgi:hypothetical protein